jgi:hypothetical protein
LESHRPAPERRVGCRGGGGRGGGGGKEQKDL